MNQIDELVNIYYKEGGDFLNKQNIRKRLLKEYEFFGRSKNVSNNTQKFNQTSIKKDDGYEAFTPSRTKVTMFSP